MAEKTLGELLDGITTDEIENLYRNKDIDAGEKNLWLRQKAKHEIGKLSAQGGPGAVFWKELVKNAQHGWDNMVEAINRLPAEEGGTGPKETGTIPNAIYRELYYNGQFLVGMFQSVPLAFLNAFGTATRDVIKHDAMSLGASPGLAEVFGIIGETAIYGPAVGATYKSYARTIQKQFGEGIGAAPKAAKLTGIMGEAMSKEELAILEALSAGLETDGVVNAPQIVKKMAGAAGKDTTSIEKHLAKLEKLAKPQTPTEIQLAMQARSFPETAARYANDVTIEQARKELPQLMKRFGITYPDLKNVKELTHGNQVMTAQEFYGHLKAMEEHVPELSKLAQAAIKPETTEGEQLAFARAATELFTGARTGRVQYGKDFMDLLIHWDPKNVANGNIAAAMKTFAQDIAAASPDHIKGFSIRSQDGYMRAGELGPMALEWYRNLLLPLSFGPTFVGNSVAAIENIAERQIGALFSADRAHGLVIAEAYYEAKGMMLATGDALRAYGMAYQTGGATRLTPGLAGWLATKPTETVVGMDAFHKVIIGRGVMYAHAIRDAMHSGLTGSAAGAHVRNLMQNPTPQMMEEAYRIAEAGTFQNSLGIISRMLTKPAQYGPGSLWFMFMKSPINFGKHNWDRFPGLQLISKKLYEDILAGGERTDMAIGRLTLSNLEAMFWYEMAKEGYVTGGGPVRPELAGAWRAVNKSYAVRTPNGHIPISGYEPKNTNIGMAADLASIRDQLDDMTAEQAFMALGLSFMRNYVNRYQWKTISDMIDLVQGIGHGETPRKALIDVALSPVTVVAPIAYGRVPGSIGTRIRGIEDPVARDTRSYLDTVMNRAHGYSQTLPPLTDGYGDVVFPPQAMGNKWLGFFGPVVPKYSPATRDRVKLEGDRLHVSTPTFGDYIGQGRLEDTASIHERLATDPIPTPITSDQRYRWITIYKNILRGTTDERYKQQNPGIESLVLDNPEYEKATDAAKRAMFQGFLEMAKSSAAKALMLEDVELGQHVLINTVKKALPQVPPAQREGVTERVANEIDYFSRMAPAQRDSLTKYGILAPDQPQSPPGDNTLTIYTPYKTAPSGSPQ